MMCLVRVDVTINVSQIVGDISLLEVNSESSRRNQSSDGQCIRPDLSRDFTVNV